jgi:hypothetical protein
MFILQLDTMRINTKRQLQDQQNGQRIVFMERTKNMVIHTLNTLTLMPMGLDVRLNLGRYWRCVNDVNLLNRNSDSHFVAVSYFGLFLFRG